MDYLHLFNESSSPLAAQADAISTHDVMESVFDTTSRFLAGEKAGLDYTVISVVVLTLGIVLVVEVLRHQLDVKASGNPFFKTVLELMYRELTTLGIVEFVIYLLHKYHENFNFAMEVVFVDVHFMLFYTAVFNAIQSILVRTLSDRRTERSWVQTEDIDLGHYVAIRKEFDRLDHELKQAKQKINRSHHDRDESSIPRRSLGLPEPPATTMSYLREFFNDLILKIRHPHLSRRKRQLLVPLRFHELRAHFIDTNNLPPKFKVSHYLKRSLTSVFLDFVHISSSAWIMLMATGNLIYFLSGMILSETKSKYSVPEFLVVVFFIMCAFFVVLVFLIYFKMRKVFSKILHMKLMIHDNKGRKKTYRDFGALLDGKAVDQVALFWGGNPHFVIVATQYMQFGYALGLAIIFTYWETIGSKYGPMNSEWLLIVLLASYGVFLHLMAEIIPWYTLCTSMGQLVNKERLHETLAKLKLGEEIRKKKVIEAEKIIEKEIARRKKENERKSNRISTLGANVIGRVAEPLGQLAETLHLNEPLGGMSKDAIESISVATTRISDAGHRLLGTITDPLCGNSNIKTTPGPHDPSPALRITDVGHKCFYGLSDSLEKTIDPPKKENVGQSLRAAKSHGLRRSVSDNDAIALMASSSSIRTDSSVSNTSGPHSPGRLSSAAAQRLSDFGNELLEIPVLATDGARNKNFTLSMANEKDSNNNTTESTSLSNINGSKADSVNITPNGTEIPLSSQKELMRPMNQPLQPLCEKNPKTEFDSKGNNDFNTDESLTPYRPQTRAARRQRLRSNSEGVAFMSAAKSSSVGSAISSVDDSFLQNSKADTLFGNQSARFAASESSLERRQERKERRRRLKTQSEGVAFMRSTLKGEDSDGAKPMALPSVDETKPEKNLETLSELVQLSVKDLPEIPEYKAKQIKPARRPRLKAVSDGVSMMRIDFKSDRKSTPSDLPAEKSKPMKSSTATTATDLANDGGEMIAKTSTGDGPKRVSFSDVARKECAPNLQQAVNNETLMHSNASDCEESDTDDVPDAFYDDEALGDDSWCRTLLKKFDLPTFFQGRGYRLCSLIFGPMICFFIVAMRVEAFNLESGALKDQENTWHMELSTAFWLEVAWYCGMMIEFLVILFVFLTYRSGHDSLLAIYAAVWGLVVNIVCLLLLLFAERERCCPDGPDCCGKYGARTFGGIGIIEPFTSLIALSPVRFIVAEFMAKFLSKGQDGKDHNHVHPSEPHGHHGPDPVIKARDLWLETIGMHSDIARKYGIFSGEFLECMLGIFIPELDDDKASSAPGNERSSHCSSSSANGEDVPNGATTNELASPMEEVDLVNSTMGDGFGVTFDDFAYPGARLVRRMRRCERKVLPFLDEWMVVDAVLTSHELVLFEVPTTESALCADVESPPVYAMSINGGKGMRLCDIAKGRKVVSQFELDDIDLVAIERYLAASCDDDFTGVNENRHHDAEFWQGGTDYPVGCYDVCAMNKRWEHVEEDRLKIHFACGTLYLRFMVDLKELESPSQGDPESTNRGSSLWCRTIARTIGSGQLKQDLPHFGDNDGKEIDDFVEIYTRGTDGEQKERRITRRFGRGNIIKRQRSNVA